MPRGARTNWSKGELDHRDVFLSPAERAAKRMCPSRADHVGSFLRPPPSAAGRADCLLEARDHVGSFLRPKANQFSRAEQLRASKTRRSPRSSSSRRTSGLQSITDGEFRRTYFHIDFLEQLGGVQDRHPGHGEEARRQRGAGAAGDARDRQGAPRRRTSSSPTSST
jgi:hypothetical protein